MPSFNYCKMLYLTAIVCFACLINKPAFAGGIKKGKIKRLFRHSVLMKGHFTGFALYNMDKQQAIYGLNDSLYFTPASNTKLFTFYTSLSILNDSVAGIKYIERGDSLLFWGVGDPAFLHPDLKGINAYNLLKQSNKKLFYCIGNYQNKALGAGWAWDDYGNYYQAEITDLPLYGNLIHVYKDASGNLQVMPAYFKSFLNADSSYHPQRFNVKRSYTSNTLSYPVIPIPDGFSQDIPWQTNDTLTARLLSDTLHKPVNLIRYPMPADVLTIYNSNADTVYRHMLQPSDNFIAEQLLLVCSSVKMRYLNTDSLRRQATRLFLNDLPDEPRWNDGSGLTRLNLFTPRTMVMLLNKIAFKVNDDELLHSLLPQGGVAGTLKHAYKTDKGLPFVWAKTGSLTNVYNQSGYLVTRKGRRLCFSFMNNNFTESAAVIRNEMARIITYIHEKY